MADDLRRWRRDVHARLPHASAELVEEVAQHLAQRWARVREATGSIEAAEAAARQELDQWARVPLPPRRRRAPILAGLGLDLRHALRVLTRQPAATTRAAVLIAIAVGATTAAFAVSYGLFWRPLPYPDAGRLAVVWQVVRGEVGQISYPDFASIRASDVFSESGALLGGVGTLISPGGVVDRVNAVEVETSVLALLGARPHAGRLLTDADAGRPVAVISHRLWQSRLGGDPAAVGRAFELSGRRFEIAGVLAPGFDFELPVSSTIHMKDHDVWLPFDTASPWISRRDVTTYEALVRLAPGVTLPSAQAAVDVVGRSLADTYAATNRDRGFRVVPLLDQVVARAWWPLTFGAAGSALILLVAVANLLGLTTARIDARRRELAMRRALGATGARVMRQLVVEHVIVAAAAGAAGIASAFWLTRWLMSLTTLSLPRPDAVRFDAPVWMFGLSVAAGVAVLLSVVPLAIVRLRPGALEVSAGDRLTARGGRASRRVVVALQMALALVLGTTSVLLSISWMRLLDVETGFSADRALAARASAYAVRYPDRDATTRFFTTVVDRLRATPGIVGAGAGSSLPLSGQSSGTSVMSQERPKPPAERASAGWQFVTPGFFQAVGMPLVRGRDFAAEDVARPHVTVINESMAHDLFGDADPIGRRISVGGGEASGDWHEVIGVVADVRHVSLAEAPAPRVYDLLGQHWGRTMYLAVRTASDDAAAAVATVRRVVADVDPEAPVFEVATLDDLRHRSAAPERVSALLAAGLAIVAVVLATMGAYALVAGLVEERMRELGVRLALGATPAQVMRMMVTAALSPAAIGCAAGVAGALLTARAMHAQLFELRAAEAWIVAAGFSVLMLVATSVAALAPARRAIIEDPLKVLRAD
jgi:putative ABC transport system permease protein